MKATGANYSRVNPSFLKMLFLYICISCRINLSNAFHHHIQPWIRPNAQATAKFGKNINSSLLHMSNEEPPLTAFLDKASKTGIDNKRIQRNSLVITKYDVPDLGKNGFMMTDSQKYCTRYRLMGFHSLFLCRYLCRSNV